MHNVSIIFITQHTASFDINESDQTTDDLQKECKFFLNLVCCLCFHSVVRVEVELETSVREIYS